MRLIDKYKPTALGDLVGQPDVVKALRGYLANPDPDVFLFTGPTGGGKSAAALALAAELGVDTDHMFGGLHRIPAGEQTADAVRQLSKDLRVMPWEGSGWRVAIVDEADHISKSAAVVWLDVLERLPTKTTIIFTTNTPGALPARFRDRCRSYAFGGDPMFLGPALQGRIDHITRQETAPVEVTAPRWQDLAEYVDGRQELSVRQVLQSLDGWIRALPGKGGDHA